MGTGFKWYGHRGSGSVQVFVEAGGPPWLLHSYMARQWLDDEAAAWAREGIDGAEAPVWKALGLRPAEAGRLDRQGITLAGTVTEWWRAGIAIGEVARGIGAGLSPAEAIRRRSRRGVVRRRWKRRGGGRRGTQKPAQTGRAAGSVPVPARHGYQARRGPGDEAAGWAREGIDGAEAPVWKALGLRPAEAGRLDRQGITLAGTVTEWWRAGIPIGEVADWIGAGLTPNEAAGQRARGVTAEHAATLRALRDGPAV